jgi:hypothetical protein
MLFQILLLFVSQLILPVYFIYSLWNGREHSRFHWLLKLLYSGAFLLYILLAGRWDWLSYYLRYLLPLLFVAAAIVSYRRAKTLPFFAHRGSARWQNNGGALLSVLVFVSLLVWAVRGFFYADEPVRLTFPLQDGWYYVGQGGNSTLLNYHNSSNAQQYALDLAELNAIGTRAWGIYPTALERYAVFGEIVHSPCDGTIVEAVDGLPDHIPPAADREHLAGNHVVISCEGVNVLLAHLQNGSVRVEEGEAVATRQMLGRVGNSGNTSEPHLHIHAVRAGSGDALEGDGVPILFEGRFAVRNTTF